MSEEPRFHMNADSLLSKYGFSDGDGLSDWWWDNFDEPVPFNDDDVLEALAERYLLPQIREAGYEATIMRIGTIHNPVRIEVLSGTEVDWYAEDDNTFEPPIYASVTRAEMEAIAKEIGA